MAEIAGDTPESAEYSLATDFGTNLPSIEQIVTEHMSRRLEGIDDPILRERLRVALLRYWAERMKGTASIDELDLPAHLKSPSRTVSV